MFSTPFGVSRNRPTRFIFLCFMCLVRELGGNFRMEIAAEVSTVCSGAIGCANNCSLSTNGSTNSTASGDAENPENATTSELVRRHCPESFWPDTLKDKPGLNFTLCWPRSCARLVNAAANNATGNFSRTTKNSSSTTNYACAEFTITFLKCSKQYLNGSDYEIDKVTGTLTTVKDGSEIEMGNYFIQDRVAMVCVNDTGLAEVTEMPQFCMPLLMPRGRHSISPDGTLTLHDWNNLTAAKFYHSLAQNRSHFNRSRHNDDASPSTEIVVRDNVCFNLSLNLLGCTKIFFLGKYMRVLDNVSLLTFVDGQIAVYDLGSYLLSDDLSKALVCFEPTKYATYYELLSFQKIISCVAAIFLLLTVLVHVFIPKLNVQAKPLLNFLLSAFCFKVFDATGYFVFDYNNRAMNYSFFVIGYITRLASYLWLNVYCFIVWHSFSHLMQNAAAVRNTPNSNNRKFVYQCIYAWGIPTMMCVVIIVIDNNSKWQTELQIQVDLAVDAGLFGLANIILNKVPLLILLIENVVLFLLTVISIQRSGRETRILERKLSKKHFVLFIKLFVIMDACWIINEILYYVSDSKHGASAYISIVVNEVHSALLFIVYVCKKRTFKEISKKWHRCLAERKDESTDSDRQMNSTTTTGF